MNNFVLLVWPWVSRALSELPSAGYQVSMSSFLSNSFDRTPHPEERRGCYLDPANSTPVRTYAPSLETNGCPESGDPTSATSGSQNSHLPNGRLAASTVTLHPRKGP